MSSNPVNHPESKRGEETLRKERDFTRNILETAQVIILVLDTEGHIVCFNPYMEEISGYLLEEVKGKDWFGTFLPPRIQERSGLFSKKPQGISRSPEGLTLSLPETNAIDGSLNYETSGKGTSFEFPVPPDAKSDTSGLRET